MQNPDIKGVKDGFSGLLRFRLSQLALGRIDFGLHELRKTPWINCAPGLGNYLQIAGVAG
jgi:hypothetical protein